MPGGGRIPPVPAWTAGVVAAIFVWGTKGQAAELPTAELTVSRTPEAASCADESTLAGELRSRMTATAAREPGPLRLGVELSMDGEQFVATLRVEGRKQGIRSLRSKGPTCDGLHDALMVTLLLLLDEHPSLDVPPPPPPVVPPQAEPPPATPPQAASAIATSTPTRGPPPNVWLSAGGALTHGLPERWWGAGSADVAVRYRSLEFSLGGVLAPRREHPLAAGRHVDVAFAGGRARARRSHLVAVRRGSRRLRPAIVANWHWNFGNAPGPGARGGLLPHAECGRSLRDRSGRGLDRSRCTRADLVMARASCLP
jgi:hypothetical protein